MPDSASRTPNPIAPPTLARNALYLLTGQIITTALAILASALLARTLGPSEFGLFYLLSSMSAFAFVFVEWGHPGYVIREISHRSAEAGRFAGSVIAFRASAALVFCGATVLAAWLLGYDSRTQILAASMIFATLPQSCGLSLGFVFRGLQRMELDAIINVSAGAFSALMLIAVMLVGGRLPAVIAAKGAAGVLTLAFAALVFRRVRADRIEPSLATARELLVGGASFVMLQIAVDAQPYVDAVVLSKFAPSAAVGWYGAAARFLGTLTVPANVLGASIYPRLALCAAAHPEEFGRTFAAGIRPLLSIGVLAAVGTWLYADLAIAIVVGARAYAPAIIILRMFAPFLLLVFANVLVGTAVIAVRRQRLLAITKFGAVALALVLEIFLVPFFQARFANGGLGVPIALAVGEVIMLAKGIRLLPPGALPRAALRDLLRGAIAGGGTLVVGSAVSNLGVAVRVSSGLLTFGVLSLVTGLVTLRDIGAVREAIRAKRGTPSVNDDSTGRTEPADGR